MKSNLRASSRRNLENAVKQICEPLEQRVLLSSAIKPAPNKLPPNMKYATSAPPSLFVGPVAPPRKTITTTTKPGTKTTPAVSINVGSVVNISKATNNQTEADLAINPTNPDQVFAVSNIDVGTGLFATRSSDGGVNWTTATIATGSDGLTAACCDARIVYDKFGNLWMVYLSTSAGSLIIARSTNNGANWTQMVSRASSWDNPAIGTGSDGSTWIAARGTGGTIAFGWKATGLGTLDTSIGSGTGFSANQVIAVAGSGNYGDVAVGNDGSVYVTWTNNAGGQGPNSDPLVRDPDGFGAQPFSGIIASFATNVGGFDFIPPQNNRSVDSEPQLVVAPPGSPFAGRIYFQHLVETVNENSDTDVAIHYSDDNGANWSAAIRVNDDPASPIRSQFLNQISVDPTTGALVASWHDSRNDNGSLPNGTNGVANDDAQFWGALSSDGGLSWTNFMIESGWSNAVAANNGIDFGDWTGSDFYAGRFFAVWASNASTLPSNPQPAKFDLATARVDITGAGTPGIYGTIFDDANGNGTRDGGEAGLQNVTVFLDLDTSGTLTGGDISTLSTAGGLYSFTGMAAGAYDVRSVTPAGLRLTAPVGGVYNVVFNGTSSITSQDFGFVNPRIAGVVFDDSNDNGVFDGAEAGLTGVTVYLDIDNSSTLNGGDVSTTSGAGGAYTLGGLANGTYTVRVVTPAGRRLTFPGGGSYSSTISNAIPAVTNDNFGLTDRVRIAGVSFRDDNGNGVRDGSEPLLAGQRVFQDLNSNSLFDNTGGTFNSTNVPLAINDNATINSTLLISGGGNITNLTVKINITHTFDADLDIFLVSPLGTRVELTTDNGSSGDNFVNTVFDDAAVTLVTVGNAPFTGSFKPETPLSALNGQNANGTWKLEVTDDAGQDTGTLTGWSITFGSTEPNQLTAGDGSYAFTGLSAGSYNLRQVGIANHVFTTPPGGGTTVNAVGGDLVTLDFGNFLTSYTGSQYYLRLDPTSTNMQLWVDDSTVNPPTYSANKNILTTLTLTGTGGDDSLTVDTSNATPLPSGGVTFAAGAHGANGDTLTVLGENSGETFAFNSGTASIDGRTVTHSGTVENVRFDGAGGGDSLTVNAGPQVQILATQHLTSVDVADGASAHVLARSIGGKKLIVTDAINLHASGTLDLDDNDMMVDYTGASSLTNVVNAIKNARNGGAWNGNGLFSTAAKNRPAANTTLGAMISSDYSQGPNFNGEPIVGTQVLVKYTYIGDANFNGKVDGADFGSADFHFGLQPSQGNIGGWANGDFDYNDKINGADFGALDFSFASQIEVIT